MEKTYLYMIMGILLIGAVIGTPFVEIKDDTTTQGTYYITLNTTFTNVNNSDYLDGYDSTYFYPSSNPSGYYSQCSDITPCGTIGPAGSNGTDGKDGVNGINGTNGVNGINGTNGVNGINGTNGINGINGTNGVNGANGSFINGSDATVRNMNITGNLSILNTKGALVTINSFVEHPQEMMTNTLLDKSSSILSAVGGVLNYTLIATFGCAQFNFNGTLYPVSASPCIKNATISLLAGTNALPKTNYLYWELVAGVPTLKSEESPGATGTISVAEFIVGAVSGSSYNIYSYSRARDEIDTFVNRVLTRIEDMGGAYKSGFTTTANTKNIKIDSGYFYNGVFLMYTNVSLNSSIDGFYRINSSGNFISASTYDSNSFNQYQTGETITNNRYVNIVWGIVPTSTTSGGISPTTPKLIAIVQSKPGTEYNSVSLAEQDLFEKTNYYPNNAQLKEVFIPIARQVVQYATGGGGTATTQVLADGTLFKDLRGKTTSSGGAPTSSTSNHATLTNLDYDSSGHTGFAPSSLIDNVSSIGNWSADKTGIQTNISSANATANTKAVVGSCALFSAMTTISSSGAPTCTAVSSMEGDPIAVPLFASYTTTVDLNNNFATKVYANSLGNWTADKGSETLDVIMTRGATTTKNITYNQPTSKTCLNSACTAYICFNGTSIIMNNNDTSVTC